MSTPIQQAVDSLTRGEFVLLIDDLDKRSRGFLFCAAQFAQESHLRQLTSLARGVVTAPISEGRLRELLLHPAQQRNSAQQRDLAIGIEARFGVSTGVSAADRAHTLRTLASTERPRTDLVIPGHIFPHLSKDGGVLVRAAAAEAATDLLEKAGLIPVAALSECLAADGACMSIAAAREIAASLGCPSVEISELLYQRLNAESLVEQITETRLPLFGMEQFIALPFVSKIDGAEHLALVRGEIGGTTPTLVRVQSEQRITDLFGIGNTNSRLTMQKALTRIDQEGNGVLIYIRHPRRGAVAKHAAHLADNTGLSAGTMAGTLREYGVGAQILKCLGIKSLRLLTTKVRPILGLENFQIEVLAQEQL
jgi:3,4-dihydroxy 2-butanone 4-phosphate synthase/GTP cyclohydrolase II